MPIQVNDGPPPRRRTPTLVLLGSVAILVAWAIATLLGEPAPRQAPTGWLAALVTVPPSGWPTWTTAIALGLLVGGAIALGGWAPYRRRWRAVAVGILLALSVRYLLWRGVATLNWADPTSAVLGVLLLLAEGFEVGNGMLEVWFSLGATDRSRQANRAEARLSELINEGRPLPRVDVLIPTLNEPIAILKRTLAGCLALDYPQVQVYLLDDGQRPEVAALAAAWGCGYLTRGDRRHAKAGNLNAALAQTEGELIVCFDADFVPTRNFLSRTVGFFIQERTGLVQTHQNFYNPDPIVANLGLSQELTTSRELFTRYVEPMRDGTASTICYGSSFVVRRSALLAVGGFVVESLAEDYATGLAIAAAGYEVVYLDEDLSAGLSPESLEGYLAQQQRWAIGSLQVLFLPESPLRLAGLRPLQRLANLHGLMYWFAGWSRLLFLLLPPLAIALGAIPIASTLSEWLAFFVPYFVAQMSLYGWLNRHSCSSLLANLYGLVQAVPIALTAAQVMVRPFGRGFRVTPKGLRRDRPHFTPLAAWPLVAIAIISLLALIGILYQGLSGQVPAAAAQLDPVQTAEMRAFWWPLSAFWLGYNLLLLGVVVLACVDLPKAAIDWFALDRPVWLRGRGQATLAARCELLSDLAIVVQGVVWGISTGVGTSLAEPYRLEIAFGDATWPDSLWLPVRAETFGGAASSGSARLQLTFEDLSIAQEKAWLAWLYGTPGRWLRRQAPGEWRSLGLLLAALVWPPLWRRRDIVTTQGLRDRHSPPAIPLGP